MYLPCGKCKKESTPWGDVDGYDEALCADCFYEETEGEIND